MRCDLHCPPKVKGSGSAGLVVVAAVVVLAEARAVVHAVVMLAEVVAVTLGSLAALAVAVVVARAVVRVYRRRQRVNTAAVAPVNIRALPARSGAPAVGAPPRVRAAAAQTAPTAVTLPGIMGCQRQEGDVLPSEPIPPGSVVVCIRCLRGDPSRSPLWPLWAMPAHEAWHDGQAAGPGPVLERVS